jgi:hypothetical protein
MVDSYVRKLFFHGAAVIWVGLLAGFPFGFVVMHRMEGDVRAWHMAHLEGVLNGLLTFGAAAALKHLSLDERRIPLYASNLAVFTMFVVAVVAVLVGLYLMMRGAQES